MPEPASRPALALSAKGFRPFFLLASIFAVAVVPVWLFIIDGVTRPGPYLDAINWHAHEMVFGFVAAVIAGFLLTAVGNWTQRETVVGAPLLGLAGVWLLGRVAVALAGRLPRGIPALVDLAFLPLLALVLARPLVATRNRRNFVMLAVLAVLFAANVCVHLDALGLLHPGTARRASVAGVDVVVLIILILSGRIFPMFTRNATGAASIRSHPRLDVATIVGMASLAVIDVLSPATRVAAIASGLVGVIAAARAAHWGAQYSLRQPLVWILHAGYAWLVLGLLLRALAGLDDAVPASLATHALTVGAIGSTTLGMMARVSLGHTGRVLTVSRPMVGAFVAVNAAALARTIVPLLAPDVYFASLLVAGTLWTAAFLVFLIVYSPILLQARVDGKAG